MEHSVRVRVIWAAVTVFIVAVVAIWVYANDRVTDHFAREDMQDDIVAMQLTPDPAPKKSGVETLPNPRIVTVTRGSHAYNAVVMNVLVGGCSVLLERSRNETSFRLEGDPERKIEVYTPISVWYNFAPIDLLQYDSQAEAFRPDELEKFLQTAVKKGAVLPCLRSSGVGASTGAPPHLELASDKFVFIEMYYIV